MNKQIKPTVYKILEKEELARKDDNYLILRVVQELVVFDKGTAFVKVLAGMRHKGISFEAITRCRRKFMEENPQYKNPEVEDARRKEEENYILEYGNHVPRLD